MDDVICQATQSKLRTGNSAPWLLSSLEAAYSSQGNRDDEKENMAFPDAVFTRYKNTPLGRQQRHGRLTLSVQLVRTHSSRCKEMHKAQPR